MAGIHVHNQKRRIRGILSVEMRQWGSDLLNVEDDLPLSYTGT